MRSASLAGMLLITLPALTGCGADGLSEVSGTVKVDGQPLDKGAITFFPMDGKAATTGGAIASGKYSVRVPAGTMKVTISAPQFLRKKKLYPDNPNSPEMDVNEERLPAKFSDHQKTELRLEVNGNTPKDWDLPTR
jgi:hypothetical protein